MLDEQHYDAYRTARTNLLALAQSADPDDGSWVAYYDLASALQQLHDHEDLPYSAAAPAQPRRDLYQAARQALVTLRDLGYIEPLEATRLIQDLADTWASDSARDAGHAGS